MGKVSKSAYYKLRRFEAQMLANYARSDKKMELPNGWVTFYRLTPNEINKKFPALTVEEIIKESRLIDVAVDR
jgi:hypothetical protein